jgi:hypothetical protein
MFPELTRLNLLVLAGFQLYRKLSKKRYSIFYAGSRLALNICKRTTQTSAAVARARDVIMRGDILEAFV